ncbi:tetratricopeptide repeat-containing sensor histidine kinase [Halocola ammonii]
MLFRKILVLLTCLIAIPLFAWSQETRLDSLKSLLPASKDSVGVELLHKIAFEQALSDPDSTMQTIERMREISSRIHYTRGIAMAFNDQAILKRYLGQYDQGLSLSDSALNLARGHWKTLEASALVNKGVCYRFKGESDLALENYLEAIEIYKELGDREQVGTVYNNIGVMFMYLEDYDPAMRYYGKALEIQNELGSIKGQAEVFNNMAIIQAYQSKFDSSLFYFEKSLELEKQRGSKKGMSECINNIGTVYNMMGEPEKAIEQIERSIAIDAEMGNIQGQLASINTIAEIYIENGLSQKAIAQLERTEKLSSEIDSKFDREVAYANLAAAYENLEDYQKALLYQKKHSALRDSILDEKQADRIAEMETKFKTREAEQELEIKSLKVDEQKASLSARKNLIIALIVGLVAIVAFAFIFYQQYKSRKNAELQMAVIREQRKGLDAVIQATEDERRRIAKDLHDGIGQQLSGLKLSISQIGHSLAEKGLEDERQKVDKLAAGLDSAATEVRGISHQMMPRALEELGLVPAIDDMLSKSFGHSETSYRFEHFKVQGKRFTEGVEIGLFRICQELVNNIIKHARASEVSVQLIRNKKHLILIVEDNGVGFSLDQKKDGIGLRNISSRVQTVNGDVNYEPSPEAGTVATIRIPVEE